MGAHDNEIGRILFRLLDDLDERFSFSKEDLIALESPHFFHIMGFELVIDFFLLRRS